MSCTFAPAFGFSSVAFNAIHSISLSIYADNLDALTALSVSFISLPLSFPLCSFSAFVFWRRSELRPSPAPLPLPQLHVAPTQRTTTMCKLPTQQQQQQQRRRQLTVPRGHWPASAFKQATSPPTSSFLSPSSVWSTFWLLALGFGASWASQLTLQLQNAARIDFTFDANEN